MPGPVLWAPDGKRLVVGNWLLDASGRRLATFRGSPDRFSPDGQHLALRCRQPPPGSAATQETRDRVCVLGNGKEEEIAEATEALGWVAGSSLLLVRTRDGFASWSADDRALRPFRALDHARPPFHLSPDGTILVATENAGIRWVDTRTGQLLGQHGMTAPIDQGLFTGGNKKLIVCSSKESAILDVAAPGTRQAISGGVCSLDPRDRWLAVVGQAGVSLRSLQDGSEVREMKLRGRAVQPRWSADGAWLIAEQDRGELALMDTSTGAVQTLRGRHPDVHPTEPWVAVQREDAVQVIAFDGARTVAWLRGSMAPWRRSTAWQGPAQLATVHDDRWSLWSLPGGTLSARVLLEDGKAVSLKRRGEWYEPVSENEAPRASFGWMSPSLRGGLASFGRWRRIHAHLEEDISEPDRSTVLTRLRDGRSLTFRVLVLGGHEYTLAMDERGRFLVDEKGLTAFQLQDGSKDWPEGADRRDLLTPGLLEEFFRDP